MINMQLPIKVFVSFVTPFLYGMERSVIGIFEALQPEIEAHFLMTYTTHRLKLPVLAAVKKARIQVSFLSDKKDWPVVRRPQSVGDFLSISLAVMRGNLDALRASRGLNVFYLSSSRAFYSSTLLLILCKLLNKPVVYSFHEASPRPSRLLRLYKSLIKHYVFPSQYTKTSFHAHNTWAKSKNSSTIPFIVKLPPTKKANPFPPNSRVILSIGQLAPYKGTDLLIKAFLQIKEDFPDVTLHLVGGVQSEFEQEFNTYINSPDAAGRIIYWGYQEGIYDFLTNAYVFVQPTRPSMYAESFGRSAVEAMAAGVPTVCFHSGVLPEHVVDEQTGLVCEEETIACLAEKLSILLRQPHRRDTYAQQAYARYMDYYAPERIKERWVSMFYSLVTSK